MQNKEIVETIINYLRHLGVAIHIYQAFSTNSTYIKLDYGALGSIRISDHKGKEKYHYKYNVRTDIEECYTDDKSNFYPANKIEVLICDILLEHNGKIHSKEYLDIKEKYKQNRKDVSFWRECEEIIP
jgi:hypothetical protein